MQVFVCPMLVLHNKHILDVGDVVFGGIGLCVNQSTFHWQPERCMSGLSFFNAEVLFAHMCLRLSCSHSAEFYPGWVKWHIWVRLLRTGIGPELYETLQACASISVSKLCNFPLLYLLNFVKKKLKFGCFAKIPRITSSQKIFCKENFVCVLKKASIFVILT